jgi:multiple sugar transport system substrate-binding protein
MGIVLNGITWGHSRGYTPLVAAAQRFQELHPDVQINWHKRSLQEFADFPIEQLTTSYDLLIIDHPWVGSAAANGSVLPLDRFVTDGYLKEQQANSTGISHDSYLYENHQWALAIDAATPVASYRNDLFLNNNQSLPVEWMEVIALAKAGKIAVPAIPIDLLMNFYTFCLARGGGLFLNKETVVEKETGLAALASMQELYHLVHPKMFNANPIAVAEMMSSTNDYWYCPFAYGYSNYARTGFAKYLLHYSVPVTFQQKPLQTTIGGTGISVSSFCKNQAAALDFIQWVCSGMIQRTLYVQHGGQPAHLSAWNNAAANELTHDFFKNCLPAMQNGYLRPRYNGYLFFQDHAGLPIQQCLQKKCDPVATLEEINLIYKKSLESKKQILSL